MNAASGPSEPPSPMSTASSMCSPTCAMSPRNPMSAICGWAHDAEQPEKCIRMTPASLPRGRPVAVAVRRASCASSGAGPLDGAFLGLDHGEAAELRAGAGDDAALEGPGERRVLLHERLGQQVVEPVLGDARDDEVLVRADADAAVAVGLGQAGQLDQVDAVHPPHRHRAADVEESALLLGVHADVVAPEGGRQLAAGRLEGEVRPLVQRAAESLGAELLGQVAHPGQARGSRGCPARRRAGPRPGTARPPGRAG